MMHNTRTLVMDQESSEPNSKIRIHRHSINMNTLSEDVGQRIVSTLKMNPTGCWYFAPAVSVTCPRPTAEFFEVLKKEQARWCRHASKTFPRTVRRSASSWVSGGIWISNNYARYLDRALCLTGILFIDGRIVLPQH